MKMISYEPQEATTNLGFLAAGWLAVHDPGFSDSPVSRSLLAQVIANNQVSNLVDAWQRLGAFRSIRAFGRQRDLYSQRYVEDLPSSLTVGTGEVWWHDSQTGNATFL